MRSLLRIKFTSCLKKGSKSFEKTPIFLQGLVNELGALLVELCLGQEHFETAILLRNTALISSLIFNSEAWYDLTKNHINELAKIDEQLLCKITGCPSKTPVCLLYLELGLQQIELILKSRRMCFLKYILDQEIKHHY